MNKLIPLLSSFSKKEKRQFKHFLSSPYFNKKKEVCIIYEYLNTRNGIRQQYDEAVLARKLFPASYPNENVEVSQVDYSKVRNAIKKLIKLAEQFLVLEATNECQPQENTRLLVDQLMKRKLYEYSHSILGKGFKQLSNDPYQNRDYLFHQFRLEEAKLFLGILVDNRSPKNKIIDVLHPLWNYSFANILTYSCSALNQKNVLNVQYELPYLNDLIKILGKNQDSLPLFVRIYYNIMMFLKEENGKTYFLNVKSLLETGKNSLNLMDLRWIYNFMLNFCTDEIYRGELDFQEERHEIIYHNLKNNIWDTGLFFSDHIFNLFISNAIEIGKIEIASAFIKEYEGKLSKKYRKDITLLGWARIAFAKNNTKEALSLLNEISSKEDFFYTLYIKVLEIKIHFKSKELIYEIQDGEERFEDVLFYAIEALRVYLDPKRNHLIGETVRTAYQEFRQLAKQLYYCKYYPKHYDKRVSLIEKIRFAEKLTERKWILEEAEKLRIITSL